MKQIDNLARGRQIFQFRGLFARLNCNGIKKIIPDDVWNRLSRWQQIKLEFHASALFGSMGTVVHIMDEIKQENCKHHQFQLDWTGNMSCTKCGKVKDVSNIQ